MSDVITIPPSGGANSADEVDVNTTNFDGVLSATEDTSQECFDKIDDIFNNHQTIVSTNSIKWTLGSGVSGNTRGSRCIDIQSQRSNASMICGGTSDNVIFGGYTNGIFSSTTYLGMILGGWTNSMEVQGSGWGTLSTILNGYNNVCSTKYTLMAYGAGNIARGNSTAYGYNLIGGDACWITYGSNNVCLGRNLQVNSHNYCTAFGNGGITSADNDFILGSGGTRAVANVHFRVAGDTHNVVVGKSTNQTAVAGATNQLRLQTVYANNQSNYVAHQANATLASSTTYIWPANPASASVATIDTNGNIVPKSPSYANMYEYNSGGTVLTMTSADVYYGWKTAGQAYAAGSSYIQFSDNATADRLLVGTSGAGIYDVNFNLSFGGTANVLIRGAVHLNGTAQDNLRFRRKLGDAGDEGSAGFHGQISMVSGDYLDVRLSADNAASVVNIYCCGLAVERIS